MKTGVWVHGRHMQTVGWEKLVWGEPPHRLGSLPMAALLALTNPSVSVLGFGTGASRAPDGTVEGECLANLLRERFGIIGEFERLVPHLTEANFERVSPLLQKPVLDTTSQNTTDEIAEAVRHFGEAGVEMVYAVTNGSHAARCVNEIAKARAAGVIPPSQLWSVMPDDMSFGGPTAVFEHPHRGDDPVRDWEQKPSQVLPKLFRIPAEERQQALQEVSDVFARYGA